MPSSGYASKATLLGRKHTCPAAATLTSAGLRADVITSVDSDELGAGVQRASFARCGVPATGP